MSIKRLLRRSVETGIKLPFAMAWDVISLGNMGDGESTSKVLREHRQQKEVDKLLDAAEDAQRLRRALK